jgi:DNA-binding NarL/FixJ family response regulator
MIKILHAEGHKMLYEGIKSLLKDNSEINIIGYASSNKEIIEQLSLKEIDVIVLDDNPPGGINSFEIINYIQQHHPHTKVLIHSISNDEENLITMFEAGAAGYILKESGMEDLVYAVKKISHGNLYIGCELALELLDKLKNRRDIVFQRKTRDLPHLSKRELEILKFISEGLTNNEIADKIFTSRRTVETHRRNLIEKTKTKNTATLIKYAILNRILLT